MTRHLIIFSACFLLGVALTAAIRTARHDAYDRHQGSPAAAPASTVAAHPGPDATAPAAPAAPAAAKPVNTLCPICGMTVNPTLPFATYQGRAIGFGCKACPPKFAAEPERYGPAALKNQVVTE